MRPAVLFDPRGGEARSRSRSLLDARRNRDRLGRVDLLLIGVAALILFFLFLTAWRTTRVDVDVTGIADGQSMTFDQAQRIDVLIDVSPGDRLKSATLTLDGEPLSDAARTESGFRWKSDDTMATGEHRLELRVPRPILAPSTFRWDFTVDATPPILEVPSILPARAMDEPVAIEGRVEDDDVTLTADGSPVDIGSGGRFRLEYDRVPAGAVVLVARDAAGHTVSREVFTPVERQQLRAVHVSGPGWATPELRQGVLSLIDQGLINAVQLDLKDEAGEVAYKSEVDLAQRIGATRSYYDLEGVVDELHERGVRVVGRIVAYRDPILAGWAWAQGSRDWVVQRPDGTMLDAYGGFTSFASRPVQDYNLALADEAAEAGVDEVLWDYIRRPEGAIADMVIPGLGATAPEDAIVGFLERGHQRLRDAGVFQGASVFGIAAARPEPVAQNIPKIARHVDYLAPMVYPSLFVNGEYRVADPARMPYDIVRRALDDFKAKTAGTGVYITPWLQDFSQVITYGDDQVRSQVRAAEDAGYPGWLLWNARVKYHTGKLDPIDR